MHVYFAGGGGEGWGGERSEEGLDGVGRGVRRGWMGWGEGEVRRRGGGEG